MAYVQISGGFEKEVRVEIDPERMTTYGVLYQKSKSQLSLQTSMFLQEAFL